VKVHSTKTVNRAIVSASKPELLGFVIVPCVKPNNGNRSPPLHILNLGLKFLEHGIPEKMLAECGLDATGIKNAIRQRLESSIIFKNAQPIIEPQELTINACLS
jgi:hypothetical protein